jgi:hypothetical protein
VNIVLIIKRNNLLLHNTQDVVANWTGGDRANFFEYCLRIQMGGSLS